MADTDIQLAGYETIGNYVPIQLYAGEKQPVTTQGVLTAGLKLGKLNGRRQTYKFGLVAEVAGKLVAFNAAGNDGSQFLKGILPHALDTSATGYNADTDTPFFAEGVFNFEAMDTALDYATLRAAKQAPGTAITFQKLF